VSGSVRPIQHDIYRNKKVFKINNIAMRRHALKMKLKPGNKEEYKKRHDEIWPELEQALKEAGIHNYSIFLDEETNTLFAVQKLDEDHTSEQLPKLPVMKKWWDFMADIMEVNPDNSPVTKPLKEVFYME
jgi:L-rhamnose mutarotase